METNEKLLYLLKFMDHYIEYYVYDVLEDSDTDPQYSAVTAANLIACYIDVMSELGQSLGYCDIKSFFDNNLLSDGEYNVFYEKIQAEKEYYTGKIFDVQKE